MAERLLHAIDDAITATQENEGADMKSILDPSFRYTKSIDTDIRKTFARIRREQQRQARMLAGEPQGIVLALEQRKARAAA